MNKCLNYKIRELRLQKRLTIQQLASALDIAPSTLGMYERGLRNPDLRIINRISKYFDVDISYFYEHIIEIDDLKSKLDSLPNERILNKVKERANGKCELCCSRAPFILNNGEPYLEIVKVKGNSSDKHYEVALCPNCHKKIDILNLAGEINYLIKKVEEHKTNENS